MPPEPLDPSLRLAALRTRYEAQLATFREQSTRLKVQQERSAQVLATAYERLHRCWVQTGEDPPRPRPPMPEGTRRD